jgi:glutaredoxin
MANTIYVKTGCPYCKAATDFLDAKGIEYQKVDVRDDAAAMEKLQKVSGQTKTPTLDQDGKVLANFGVEELEEFLGRS